MKETKNSDAYNYLSMIWKNQNTDSYRKLNEAMRMALNSAIKANLEFYENDFDLIQNTMRGGYWFGVNSNGKGMGESFYLNAIKDNNVSAFKSFEKWVKLKPFITKDSQRVHSGLCFRDKNKRYNVTGFDFELGKIYLVSYDIKDWEEKGKRQLHNFTNKEWLIFRKNIEVF